MSKRGPDDGGSGQPPIKKVHFEPHLIGSVSTLEEMDIKVLKFQHKKLAQVLSTLILIVDHRQIEMLSLPIYHSYSALNNEFVAKLSSGSVLNSWRNDKLRTMPY